MLSKSEIKIRKKMRKLNGIKMRFDRPCEMCTETVKAGGCAYQIQVNGWYIRKAHLHTECGEAYSKTGATNIGQAIGVMDDELKDYGVDTDRLDVRDVVRKYLTMRYIKEVKQPDANDSGYKKDKDSRLPA